jgi:hypothetical protein
MLLLGDWGQQMDIEDQRRELSSLSRRVRSESRQRDVELADRMDRLERENDELRLYLASLVRYLGSKELLDKAEFARLVEVVDVEDGQADGGFDGPVVD